MLQREAAIGVANADRLATTTNGSLLIALSSNGTRGFAQPLLPNYTAVLCDSHFVLAPRGVHLETWRLTEALDCGAIPVILEGAQRDYYAKLMPTVARHFLVLGLTCKGTYETGPCYASSPRNTTSELAYLAADPHGALAARRAALVESYEAARAAWTHAVARDLRKMRESHSLSPHSG